MMQLQRAYTCDRSPNDSASSEKASDGTWCSFVDVGDSSRFSAECVAFDALRRYGEGSRFVVWVVIKTRIN
jgi:hypothetical protein